ncbi:MAG TPA: anti-sigma factor antagonist [Mycobacterium sp.]|jgi:anti-anti-sigma factor|nr:anti-sigma factor antagonist [Mycobacterium sp.]
MSSVIEHHYPPAVLSARWPAQFGGVPGALRAAVERSGSAVIVSADGEVDVSNQDEWEYVLSKAAATTPAPGPFVIDVRDLNFMGSGAYAALAREADRCRRRKISVRLVSQQPIVARTVAACGLRPVLAIYPSLAAAFSWNSSPSLAAKNRGSR